LLVPGFLAREDQVALEIPPEQRLIAERVRRFVADLAKTNSPGSVAIQVDALYKAARIMLPQVDLTWLKNMKARLHAAAPCVGATGPVITSPQLLELGEHLMGGTNLQPGGSMRLADAVQYRDGLMFALFAYAPMRRKNDAAIEIGRELIQDGGHWFLVFPRGDTKNKMPIEFEIPERLMPYLDKYLELVRPRLLRGRRSNALWVSAKARKLSYAAIGAVFDRHTFNHFGFRVTPHDARDAGATTWQSLGPIKSVWHPSCWDTQIHVQCRGITIEPEE
jgi:integrase/recombinase XerD